MSYKVVFFGTPDFSVPSLKCLLEHNEINVCAVVSMPDRPAGRGKKLKTPPVAEAAKENGLKLFQTENVNKDEEFLEFLKNEDVDFMVVIAFAQFLGKKVLESSKFGAFNIHTSLLPKYRGAAPIQYAILNGDKETGVSIQKMVKKMDAGDICYEHKVTIEPNDTSETLFNKLQTEAASGLKSFIDHFISNSGEIEFRPQDPEHVSFAPTIKKVDGLINPYKESANQIINKLRAYTPWPGCHLYLNDFRIKVLELEPFPKKLNPGEIDTSMGSLVLGTVEGALHLKTVQPDGKKAQADSNFLNGIKSKGITLEINKEHYV